MENKQYFILEDEIRKGPFTYEEVRNYGIGPNTRIWYAGLEKWVKASSVPELQDALTLLPPDENKSKKWLTVIGAVVLLAISGFAYSKYFSGSGEEVLAEAPSLNNQQLYTQFTPGIVLIQHKYIYVINTGIRKFYCNEFLPYDNGGFLSGLTEDSTAAVNAAEPIQGTGFFVSNNGKLLTNRHVAPSSPPDEEQERMAVALVHQLNSQADYSGYLDSIKSSKGEHDSLLAALIQDTLTDVTKIAEVKQKIAEALEYLEASAKELEMAIEISQATVDSIASAEISVKRITLDLRIFLPGSMDTHASNGIRCRIIANSDDPEVDLALMQTVNQTLPAGVTLPDFTRIINSEDEKFLPQMSERLVLIGYNEGTFLSKTSDGIKAQLTEGKISQNTDRNKLMYTIPTLPGSSGSPVLDEKGRLVSVNFAGVSQTQSFNYGIQPGKIKAFLKKNNVVL